MNILDKIKKNWNHKESVKKNVIRFSNEQEQKQKKIKKWYPLFIGLFIIACLVFPINPLVGICLMIGTISFGSESVFKSAETYITHIAVLDSTHFVIVYNSNAGYQSVIGTINGSSISYGSEYTAPNIPFGTIDVLDSTHFVVSTANNSSTYIYCTIGTVSNGNQISYGTTYTVNTTSYPSSGIYRSAIVKKISSTSFIVLMGNTYGYIAIGTVSNGNQISYGSSYATNIRMFVMDIAVLDSTHFVITYGDVNDNFYSKAVVGIMSGSTISGLGAPILYRNQECYQSRVQAIDSTHFIATYSNRTSRNTESVIGTVSYGTSISWGDYYEAYSFFVYASVDLSLILLDSTHFVLQAENQVRLGIISNTDEISFETAVTFNGGGSVNYSEMYKISDTDFVLSYVDVDNSNKGTVVIGTNPPPIVAPTVTTQSATNIAQTSCTGNGNITATGGANATRRGFCYKVGTLGDPTVADSVAYDDGDFGTGAFTKSITGLTAGTDYRVRAYAVNSAGISYGATVQVTTVSKPTLTADYGSFTLTGQAALFHSIKKMTAVYGSFVLTGQAISLKKILHVICSAGSFTLTGQSAILRSIKKMICAVGSFTLTGQDALFHKTLHLIGGLGSFALTGFDVILFRGRILACEVGTFVLTGYDALFHRITKMTAEVGAFVLTGYDAALYKVYKLICGMGSYILTGQDVAFKKILRMTLEVGSFTLTGEDIILYAKRILTSDVGSFVLTGQDVSFKKILRMACLVGDYVLTGFAINMYRLIRMACNVGVFILTGFGAALQKTLHIIGLAGSYVLTGFKATFTGHGDWLWKITPKDDGSGWTITPKN